MLDISLHVSFIFSCSWNLWLHHGSKHLSRRQNVQTSDVQFAKETKSSWGPSGWIQRKEGEIMLGCETLKNRWKSVKATAFFSPSPRSTLNTSTKARPPSAPRNCSFGGLPGPSPVQVKDDPGSAFALWYCGQFQHPAGSTEGPTHLPPGTVAAKLLWRQMYTNVLRFWFEFHKILGVQKGCSWSCHISGINWQFMQFAPELPSGLLKLLQLTSTFTCATLGCHAADVGEWDWNCETGKFIPTYPNHVYSEIFWFQSHTDNSAADS